MAKMNQQELQLGKVSSSQVCLDQLVGPFPVTVAPEREGAYLVERMDGARYFMIWSKGAWSMGWDSPCHATRITKRHRSAKPLKQWWGLPEELAT